MASRKNLLIGCVLLIFFSLRCAFLSARIEFNSDEISWFFHTEFFNQLLKRDIDRKFWTSYESYDHPQLSKYIFGGYLYVQDKDFFAKRDALEKKWGRWDFYFNSALWDIKTSEFAPYILRMREINTVFTVGSLMFLYGIILAVSGNIFVAILLPILLSFNALFHTTMLRATSDAQMVFFVLLSLCGIGKNFTEKKLSGLVLLGISIGCAVSAKLTGLIMVPVFMIYQYVLVSMHKVTVFEVIKKIVVVLSVIGFVWYILNPALYGNYFGGTWEYIDFRNRQSMRLGMYFPDRALVSIQSRIYGTFCAVANPACTKHPGAMTTNVYINIVLACIGFVAYVKKIRNNYNIWPIFIFILAVLTVNTAYLPLDSDRYYLLPVICVYIVYAVGFEMIADLIRSIFLKENKKPHTM